MREEITPPREALAVLQKIEEAGGRAYLVGGCVRDALRGAAPKDWDLCSSLPARRIMELFGEKALPTGLKHGTVTVRAGAQSFEVTTFRIDGEYRDGRHPASVTFTPSLTEDLKRRDFTLNAMAWHPREGLTDPFGGENDLKAGLIRCVGEPEQRFREDGLRILRGLRFASQLGFALEEKTGRALLEERALLDRVSRERVRDELTKALCGEHIRPLLLEYREVFAQVIPEIRPMFDFDQHSPWHIYDVWTHTAAVVEAVPPEDPALRLAALLHDMGKPASFRLDESGRGHFPGHDRLGAEQAEGVLQGLRYDRGTTEAVTTLIRWHDTHPAPEEANLRRFLPRLGRERFFQLLTLMAADDRAKNEKSARGAAVYEKMRRMAEGILERGDCLSLGQLAVSGEDLIDLGIAPGPALGEVLGRLLDAVLADPALNRREILLKMAAKTPSD